MRRLILAAALLAPVGCATGPERTNAMPTKPRKLTIDLLALDLDTCGRCTGTGANLDSALATVADVLREGDVEVEVRRTVVNSAAQAEQLRFESSPTVRIDGRDIALETRESDCGDCSDISGCEGQVACRVWVWQGEEHVEAPEALIVDAVLRAYEQPWTPVPEPSSQFRLPDNLRKFFEAKARSAAPALAAKADCCDRSVCCDAEEKEACCSVAAGGTACGCRD